MRLSFPEYPSFVSRRSIAYLGIILIGANLRAPITSLGPVLPDIQESLHLNGFGAGFLNSLPLLIFAFLSLIAPAVGRRGLEHVLGWAVVAIFIGTLVRSLALPGAIWIGTALLSAGIAFGNVLLPGLVKREFPAKATNLIGLYAAAMAGMAGLAAGLAVPIARFTGSSWRWAIGVWALLALAAVIIWAPQWKRRSQQHFYANGVPQNHVSPWRHVVGWQVSLFFALHSLVFYSIVDWFATYATSAGVTAEAAGYYLLIYQVVAVATNLGSAPLIKRFADQTMLGFSCGLFLLIGTAGLLLLPHLSWLWLIAAGLGAGIAMVTSLSFFTLRTHDHHQAAALSGMAQFIGYLGAAAGPLLVGALHDVTQSWIPPLGLLMVSSVFVILFAVLAGRNRFIE